MAEFVGGGRGRGSGRGQWMPGRTQPGENARRPGFLIEAVFVLALLMVSLAVFVRLFSMAQLLAVGANRRSEAVAAAVACAEEFSADPAGVPERTTTDDGLDVRCVVESEERRGGTYYEADIAVSYEGEAVYELQTSRYVGGGETA